MPKRALSDESSSDDNDEDWRSSSKVSRKSGRAPVKKKTPIAEDGELSESGDEAQMEQQSKSRSRSDSESSEEGPIGDSLAQGVILGDEDRRKLAGLTELEREQLLLKRIEEKEQSGKRREIQKKLLKKKMQKGASTVGDLLGPPSGGSGASDSEASDAEVGADLKAGTGTRSKKRVGAGAFRREETSPSKELPSSSASASISSNTVSQSQLAPDSEEGTHSAHSPSPLAVAGRSDRRRMLEEQDALKKASKFSSYALARQEKKNREQQRSATSSSQGQGSSHHMANEEGGDGGQKGPHHHRIKASDVYSDSGESETESISSEERRSSARSASSKVKGTYRPRSRSRSLSGSDSDREDDESRPRAGGEAGGSFSTAESSLNKEEELRLNKPASGPELNKMRLTRNMCERFVHMPFFTDLATGSLVRVGIGGSRPDGTTTYRIAEVISVLETAKVYSLGTLKTNKGFKLRIGRQERMYRLEYISNQPFTTAEIDQYTKVLMSCDMTLPLVRAVENKAKQFREAIAHQFTESDVTYILGEAKKFQKDPVNISMRKAELVKEREAALTSNDIERLADVDHEIEEIDEKIKAHEKKLKEGSLVDIKHINQKNRETSIRHAEQALKAEWEEQQSRGGAATSDPFTRRQLRPTMITCIKDDDAMKKVHQKLAEQYTVVNYLEGQKGSTKPSKLGGVSGSLIVQSIVKQSSSPMSSPAKGSPQTAPRDRTDGAIKLDSKLSATASAPLRFDEAFLHDLVDVPIPIGPLLSAVPSSSNAAFASSLGSATSSSSSASSIAPRPSSLPGRNLKLDEYKKRRGLI